MTVNWRDFVERVAWTAIQAFAASILVTGLEDWKTALGIAGTAAAIAACKVTVAQQVGDRKTGDAFPGGTT